MALNFDSGLTPPEIERLGMLCEEMGESLQNIGKILRHGYESYDPTKTHAPSNRTNLEKELGDVQAVKELMVTAGDISPSHILHRIRRKLQKLQGWNHYQDEVINKALGEM